MKISRTTRWILTIGILAIFLASLTVLYLRQTTELRYLNASIIQAQQNFKTYTTQEKELEAELNQVESSIPALPGEFSSSLESVEISDALLEAADEANVTITEFSTSLPDNEEINGITYRVVYIDLTAEGKMVSTLNFAQKLGDRFPSSEIQQVEIEVTKVGNEAEEGEEEKTGKETEEEKASLSLSLKIYAYEVNNG
ncbi:MAG: hypothetical protein J7L19_00865 [Dehalococcoidia bacterium]|nr:hypothetical protein [Dehalococcoidia bacterium]